MQLGLDFGTSYTKMAAWQGDRMIDLLGTMRIPSLITYKPETGRLFHGLAAFEREGSESESAHFFKLNLKRNPGFNLGPYDLESLLYHFFTYLMQNYLQPRGIKPSSINLSIPNNFGLRPRHTLITAARKAFALDDVQLMPEPLAALTGYNVSHPGEPLQGDLLIIDVGGGTVDFSFLSLSPGRDKMLLESQFQVGQDGFSGSEVDRAILRRILAPAYQMQHGEELPAHLLNEVFNSKEERYWFYQWMDAAERIKTVLSTEAEVDLELNPFYQNRSLFLNCSRADLKEGLKPVFERFERYWLESVQERAEVLGFYSRPSWRVDAILLLGGGSRTTGLADLIGSLCPGIRLIQPEEPDLYVIKGLSCWLNNNQFSGAKLKTIFPFRFYLETLLNGVYGFEEIPFDTSNLELDWAGSYHLCSIPADSCYNLSPDDQRLQVKIFEMPEEDVRLELPRFMDQDLVLDLDLEKHGLESALDVYLNLRTSRLELDNKQLLSAGSDAGVDLLCQIRLKQKATFDLVSAYRFMDEMLLRDYEEHLSGNGEDSSNEEGDSETALFKILTLLNIYRDK